MQDERIRHIIDVFLQHNVLMSGELLDHLENEEVISRVFEAVTDSVDVQKLTFLNENTLVALSMAEEEQVSQVIEPIVLPTEESGSRVRVVHCPEVTQVRHNVEDFVSHLRTRYELLRGILMHRRGLQDNVTSISRVNAKKDRDKVAVIALVSDVTSTKNGNIMLELEDTTGKIKVLVNKTKTELFQKAKEIVEDEVIIRPDLDISMIRSSSRMRYTSLISPCIRNASMRLTKHMRSSSLISTLVPRISCRKSSRRFLIGSTVR